MMNLNTSDYNDRTIAKIFEDTINQYYYLDYLSEESIQSLFNLGFYSNGANVDGRGVYWFNEAGINTFFDISLVNFAEVQGFTVDDQGKIVSLVWASNALPFFQSHNGTIGLFDYFECGPFVDLSLYGCEWMDYPVVGTSPPPKISQNDDEKWYTEVFCLYERDGLARIDRAITYNECIFNTTYDPNPFWINGSFPLGEIVWSPPSHLLHLALFETQPNPSGKFMLPVNTTSYLTEESMNARALSIYGELPDFY
jgi:hypothetical protein